jgi:hypothetical protein
VQGEATARDAAGKQARVKLTATAVERVEFVN